jgi:hypothetical protein
VAVVWKIANVLDSVLQVFVEEAVINDALASDVGGEVGAAMAFEESVLEFAFGAEFGEAAVGESDFFVEVAGNNDFLASGVALFDKSDEVLGVVFADVVGFGAALLCEHGVLLGEELAGAVEDRGGPAGFFACLVKKKT